MADFTPFYDRRPAILNLPTGATLAEKGLQPTFSTGCVFICCELTLN